MSYFGARNTQLLCPPLRPARTAGTRQALLLIVANVLPTMGIVSLIPIIPQLFAQFHNSPNAGFLVPAIISAPSVCVASLSLVAGWLGDRVGRRRLLLAALLFYAIIGCAPLFLNDLNEIVATRVLLGVADAIIMTCVATLMGDYFKGKVRQKWLAWQNAVGSLLATGIIVLGGILGSISWRAPFIIYVLSIPVFLMTLKLTWEPESEPEKVGDAIIKPPDAPFPFRSMLIVYAVSFFGAIMFFVEMLQLGLVMARIGRPSPDLIGFVTAGTGFALPVGAYLFGRTRTLRVGYAFGVALAFYVAGFYLLAISQTIAGIIWGASLAQFACGITFPLMLTWAQSKLHFGVRAFGMGLWNTAFFSGQFASSMLAAYLAGRTGSISGALYVFAVLCAVALPLSVLAEAMKGKVVAKAEPV